MPKGFQSKPNMPSMPKSRRRVGLDFYEWVAFVLWFFCLGGILAFRGLTSWGPLDWGTDTALLISNLFGAGLVIDSIILFRFDKIAVSRAKDKFSSAQEKYEYDLKDYEHLRGKWIELETVRLENQMSLSSANMSNKGSYIVASASQVGIQPSSEDTTASEIEEISTSDETN